MAKQYVEISENDYPSKEKIWDRLYQCRDFELSHFWQKSIFLFALLSLCFGGYGALVSQVVNTDTKVEYLPYIYQYMCGISLLGIILSIVWIYMAKGSKAWYEVYEKSIYEIECEIFKDSNKKYIEGEFAKRMSKNFNNNFWDNKSGAFSPSKINMVIGWIMLIVWCICGFFGMYNWKFSEIENIEWADTLPYSVGIIVVTVVLQWFIRLFIKSKPLMQNKSKKLYWEYCKHLLKNCWSFFKKHKVIITTILVILLLTIDVSDIIWIRWNFILFLVFFPIFVFICCIINNDYNDFVKTCMETILKHQVNDVIEDKVNVYASEYLKDDMKCFHIDNNINCKNEIDEKINEKIETLIKNRVDNDVDMIIEKFLQKRISEIIAQKVNSIIEQKVKEVEKSLKDK